MVAQLAMELPADTREPFVLPLDHPVARLASAPYGPGPDHFPGFVQFADMVDEALHERRIALWNALGGSQIRWDAELGEYVTRDGDRYPKGDVEDVIRGLERSRT